MIDLLLIVGIVIGAFRFGWLANQWWEKYKLNNFEKELEEDLDKLHTHFVKNFVNIKLEQVNDVIYAYDMKDESFICQGKTKEEIMECFNKRYPDKKGLIHKGGEIWKNN